MHVWTITKEFKFDAAHRLVAGYQGKCAHVHGHEWRVRVTLQSNELDRYGFVDDFNNLGWLKRWIDETLDHACIVSAKDDSLQLWLTENDQRRFTLPDNPTSEALAQYIFTLVERHYGRGTIFVKCVEVDETCTSSCKYEWHL